MSIPFLLIKVIAASLLLLLSMATFAVGDTDVDHPPGALSPDQGPNEGEELFKFRVTFVGDTPRIRRRTVTVEVEANKPVQSILCYFNGRMEQDCTAGTAVFRNVPYTVRPYQVHYLKIVATSVNGEVSGTLRKLPLPRPGICFVHFINSGIEEIREGTIKLDFTGNGPVEAFHCRLDNKPIVPCSSGKVFTGLSAGLYNVRVMPHRCKKRKSIGMKFRVQSSAAP